MTDPSLLRFWTSGGVGESIVVAVGLQALDLSDLNVGLEGRRK